MAKKPEVLFIYRHDGDGHITVFYKSGRWKSFWNPIPQRFLDYIERAEHIEGHGVVQFYYGDLNEARKQFDRARYGRR